MKIAIVSSLAYSLTNFRGALIAELAATGHELLACAPDEDAAVIAALAAMGVRFMRVPMGRTKLNPLEDGRTLVALVRMLRRERPDLVLAYTQKPIIYSGLATRLVGGIRFLPMVSGLGYVFSGASRSAWLKRLVTWLYRAAVTKAPTVIVFNRDDRDELRRRRIARASQELLVVPGSGVDLEWFRQQPVPEGSPVFLLVARLLVDKGIREYAAAARIVRARFPAARIQLLGPLDPRHPAAIDPASLDAWQQEGAIEYLGETRDVRPFLGACSVFVLPSYREGLPRTALEAMATGRAIVTTDAPGCRESVEEGANGCLVPVGDAGALAAAMMRFCADPRLAPRMGAQSRKMALAFAVQSVNRLLRDRIEAVDVADRPRDLIQRLAPS